MNKITNIALFSTGMTLAMAWWVLFESDSESESDADSEKPNVGSEVKNSKPNADSEANHEYHSGSLSTSKTPKRSMILRYKDIEDDYVSLLRPTRSLPGRIRRKKGYKPQVPFSTDLFYKKLQRDFETTQITLTNRSDIIREIRLWGGNKDAPLSPALPGDINDFTIRTLTLSNTQVNAIYPQGIIVNPYNGFTYIANQLSGNVSVLDPKGNTIDVIPLSSSTSASGSGSVSLAIHTLESSPNYGKVYVANCIADTISVIGRGLTVEKTIPVGKRPIAIAFNPFNENVYVANIADNTVSIIDTTTETVINTVQVGVAPRAITVIPESGNVYVVNSKENTLSVIGVAATILTTIDIPGENLIDIAYVPDTNKLYVVSEGTDQVFPVAVESNSVEAPIAVGRQPVTIVYNPINKALYVGNREDNTYTVLDTTEEIIDTIAVGSVGNDVAIDPVSNTILSSNSVNGELTLLVYSEESNQILINEEYHEKREDFIYQPALVKHVKFILSGEERFTVLKLAQETVTGTTHTKPISFSNYLNPQNFSNVAEVFEMEGTMIDGKNSWLFKIAPRQSMTILTYYKQLDRFNEPQKFQHYE